MPADEVDSYCLRLPGLEKGVEFDSDKLGMQPPATVGEQVGMQGCCMGFHHPAEMTQTYSYRPLQPDTPAKHLGSHWDPC